MESLLKIVMKIILYKIFIYKSIFVEYVFIEPVSIDGICLNIYYIVQCLFVATKCSIRKSIYFMTRIIYGV